MSFACFTSHGCRKSSWRAFDWVDRPHYSRGCDWWMYCNGISESFWQENWFHRVGDSRKMKSELCKNVFKLKNHLGIRLLTKHMIWWYQNFCIQRNLLEKNIWKDQFIQKWFRVKKSFKALHSTRQPDLMISE